MATEFNLRETKLLGWLGMIISLSILSAVWRTVSTKRCQTLLENITTSLEEKALLSRFV